MLHREWLGEKNGIQTTSWGNEISEGPHFLFSHCLSLLVCPPWRDTYLRLPDGILLARSSHGGKSFREEEAGSWAESMSWKVRPRISTEKLAHWGAGLHPILVFTLEYGEGSGPLTFESPPAGEGLGADGNSWDTLCPGDGWLGTDSHPGGRGEGGNVGRWWGMGRGAV